MSPSQERPPPGSNTVVAPTTAARAGHSRGESRHGRSSCASPRTSATCGSLPGIAIALLLALTAIAYSPLGEADFINYDDDVYVTQNPFVRDGFSWRGLGWAFTRAAFNWHPLTWISHMLDCQLFGSRASLHHITSVVLHIGNGGLLLYVLVRLTGALWPSVFVAALFALHPLNVESVAWISERKSLLSTSFWLAAMLSYVRYTERRTASALAAVCAWMVLSLLCKGMVVTLPVVLLLLDNWPLSRRGGEDRPAASTGGWADHLTARDLLWEKWPLALVSLVGIGTTLLGQQSVNAISSFQEVPLSLRLINALVSYAAYIEKTFWPVGLAIPYPLRGSFPPVARIASAATLLTVCTAIVVAFRRDRPYLLTGWLWYLVTLLPVIGLVQIGHQSMADRYAYVPLIGLFTAIAWGAADIGRAFPPIRPILCAGATVAVVACSFLTHRQAGVWRSDEALFGHSLSHTTDNYFAQVKLASALYRRGAREPARRHYTEALRIHPNSAEAHYGLALLSIDEARLDAAERHLSAVLRLEPSYLPARRAIGIVMLQLGNVHGAMEQLRIAVRSAPEDALSRFCLAQALGVAGDRAQALAEYERALRLDDSILDAHYLYGVTLETVGRRDEAIAQYVAELRTHPGHARATARLRELGVTDGGPPAPASPPAATTR